MNKIIEEEIKIMKQANAFIKALEEGEGDVKFYHQVIERMRNILLHRARTLSQLHYPIQIIKENAHWIKTWGENLELVIKTFEERENESTN